MTEEQLTGFCDAGEPKGFEWVMDGEGKFQGSVTITFFTAEAASLACRKHEQALLGRAVAVTLAEPKRASGW